MKRMLIRDGLWSLRGRPTGFYVGWVGHGNLGDEILCWAAQRLFAGRLWLRTARRRPLVERMLSAHRRATIMGGGTLIRPEPSFRVRFQKVERLGPPGIRLTLGTGVADAEMWERWGRSTDYRSWVEWLEECDYVSIRGPISERFLREWGLKRPVHVIGDPAMAFRRPSPKAKTGRRRIGLNLGPTKDLLFGRSDRNVLEVGAEVIRRLAGDGWEVTLFPMSQQDLEFMQEAARLAGAPVRMPDWAMFDLDRFLDAMEDQELFLGEKLHSVVMAACAGTPPVALVYRTKCLDFMTSLDRADWTLRTDRFNAGTAVALVKELAGTVEQEQRKLMEKTAYWTELQARAVDEIISLAAAPTSRSAPPVPSLRD